MARTKQTARKRKSHKLRKLGDQEANNGEAETREETAVVDSSIAAFTPPTPGCIISEEDQFRKKFIKPITYSSLGDSLKELNQTEIKVIETVASGKDAILKDHPSHVYKDLVMVLSCLKRLELETQRDGSIHTMVVCESTDAVHDLWEKFQLYLPVSPDVKIRCLASEETKKEITGGAVDILIGTQEEFESILEAGDVKEELKQVKHVILDNLLKPESEKTRDLLYTMENEQLVCWVGQNREVKLKTVDIKELMIDPALNQNFGGGPSSSFKLYTQCTVKTDPDARFQTLFELLQHQCHLKVLVIAAKQHIEPMFEQLTKHGIKAMMNQETGEVIKDTTEKFQQWESGVLISVIPDHKKDYVERAEAVDLIITYHYGISSLYFAGRMIKIATLSPGLVINLVTDESGEQNARESGAKYGVKIPNFTNIAEVRDFYNDSYERMWAC